MSDYILYFLGGAVLALIITPIVRRMAFALGCVDVPRPPRNLHSKVTAKLGGVAVFVSFLILVGIYIYSGQIDYNVIPLKFILGIVFGGLVLMIEGFLDDKYDLPAKYLWVFPALSAFIIVISGIGVGITELSNPFGGSPISIKYSILGLPLSGIFVWLWMMGMMFTTKFLDGLDGLVAGISTIASFALFFLSLTPQVNQPITATLAIIFAGALVGYLFYAFNPAKIFLGDGGSLFTGFMLGVLSIILGGKIATALLVMGIPILDVAWVIIQRLWYGRSPFQGDRRHLHFKLLDLGFSHRNTVLILYALSAVFGFTAVFLQSRGKLIALAVMFVVMVLMITFAATQFRKNRS